MVKELRDKTNAGIMDCKSALQESQGDMEKAVDYLRQKGLAVAQKRAGRAASEGVVHSYIHAGGKIGVMVEVNCETDFTAKSEPFLDFAKNLAMHIAATSPLSIDREGLSPVVVAREQKSTERKPSRPVNRRILQTKLSRVNSKNSTRKFAF
jgi:elongation factor Ts